MNTTLWAIRVPFLVVCMLAGHAVSVVRPTLIAQGELGALIGLGLGGFLIGLDVLLRGFSLRAFSAATFGLLLGSMIAWLLNQSQLFVWADAGMQWLIRLGTFLAFGYIGIILAMRSNKEDFSLIIPYVRFASQHKSDHPLILDTSVIIDGRIADLLDARFLEGIIVVPRVVLRELQQIADSADPARRARGRRGLDMLRRIQQSDKYEVRIHEAEMVEEAEVDGKLVRLTRALGGRLITNDYNLGKIAELQSVPHLNLNELAIALKPVVLPGEMFSLRIAREGKDKGQGVGYLPDGTMVVVNHGQGLVGQHVQVQVQSLLQTGAGVIVFADLKVADAA